MNSLLIDFNNIKVSKLFSKDVMDKTGYEVHNINYDIWKYSVFQSVYGYFSKFNNIDEVVIAVDYPMSWRKSYFPRYKEHRKKTKDKFNIDWDEYNHISLKFMVDIQKHMPFKVMLKKYAEGDDIIGSIVLDNKDRKFIIISSDQDYLQLCSKNVKLFSILKQELMSHPNPEMFLQESSLKGQPKDNIFNVITPLDYPEELRKPGFGEKKAEKFLIDGLEKSLNQDIEYKRKYVDKTGETKHYNASINLKERYNFNRTLMDFNKIPKILSKSILNSYYNYEYPHPQNIYKFFEKYQWPWYLDNITNVENKLYTLYQSDNNNKK